MDAVGVKERQGVELRITKDEGESAAAAFSGRLEWASTRAIDAP
jgi:hypothetical protein